LPGSPWQNLEAVKKAGFTIVFIWGVEWIFWMKEQGHPEMWEMVKRSVKE